MLDIPMFAVSSSWAQRGPCDVGPTSIISPPGIVYAESTYTPSAIIKNFGTGPADSIPVVCTINSYADTVEILNIPGLESVTVNFANWTVPDTGLYIGSYRVHVFTEAAADTDSTNDELAKSVFIVTDTLIIVSSSGFTNSTVRVPLRLVNPYHTLGGIAVGVFLNTPGVAAFTGADYSNSAISYWEWLEQDVLSPTTIYLDAIAETGAEPITPPLQPSSEERLLCELLVQIDPDAPGTILPYDWSDYNDDFGQKRWVRYETNPRTDDACASVSAEVGPRNSDWLITPKLFVTSGDSLTFWYRAENGGYPESVEVRLSYIVDIDSFTAILWGANVTNTEYVRQKINLTPYAGDSVYIGFVYRSQDKQRLYIDDVTGPDLSEGFERASTMVSFSVTSFLVDSTGYYYYLPTKYPGVLYVEGGLCGDANGDGRITIADATYLVAFIYRGGPGPIGQGDVNLDGRVTIADATYIVAFVYRGGPAPCEPGDLLNLHRKGGEKK